MTINKMLILFFLCSLVNVMLSTMKSILTVRSTKLVATLINAITYSFYTIVLKQLVGFDFQTTAIVTFFTNMIGVYTSMWILEKTKKDHLWKISVTTERFGVVDELEKHGIQHYWNEVKYKDKDLIVIDIFSYSSKESEKIKECLNGFKIKYNITEIKNRL